MLRYRVRPHLVHEHLLEVEVHIPTAEATAITLRWPSWIPGSYMIREYARHVVSARARCEQVAVPIHKTAKDTWALHRAPASRATTVVSFVVYAFDASVRGAFLSAARMYLNGAAIFPEWTGYDGPIQIDLLGAEGTAWQVATTLTPLLTDAQGFGSYRAENFDALLDHPIECGNFERLDFSVADVPHCIVVTGAHKADLARLTRDTQRICAEHIRQFHGAGAPPFKQYLFLLNVIAEGYGGLEHRDSTSLTCSRNDLPAIGDPAITEGYLGLLGLISHEYFHAWNVKRMRPQAFVPYDLSREAFTKQLWIYEGFTSYYDDLALVRAGVITREDYLRLIGRNLTALARTPGRQVQSVAAASFDAWIKYYRADENAPNALSSYYLKGGLLALLLDLTLRTRFGQSLDALFDRLWDDYCQAGADYAGTSEDALLDHLSALTGQPWTDWFKHYVDGVEPLPLEAALAEMGVRVRWRAAATSRDRGGRPETASLGTTALALGFSVIENVEVKVRSVYAGGAAASAGLSSGDVLIALDHLRINTGVLDEQLSRYRAGDPLTFHFFRDGKLNSASLVVPASAQNTAWCEWNADASEVAKSQCERWLSARP
jgi:predicted metalloprotease with PDZ domain